MQRKQSVMRTFVYVDGFNFYHGRIKRSGAKWLDLVALFEKKLLPLKSREAELLKLKFFTSEIKAKFASRGQDAHQAQQSYHRALTVTYPSKVEIIKGYYSERVDHAMAFVEGSPPSKLNRTRVWKLEEKQTDVLMALEMYRDASLGLCDQIVVCSNDSDMEPSISLIKQDFPHIRIGMVIPREQDGQRVITSASERVDWVLNYISNEALAESQYPDTIPTRRKPIRKPAHW